MKQSSMEVLLGLFVIAGLVLLAGLVVAFGQLLNLSRPTYEVKVDFTRLSGIGVGAPVRMLGIDIGKVAAHDLLPGGKGVRLTLAVYGQYSIPDDARMSVQTEGLLGDYYLEFSGGTGSPIPHDGAGVVNPKYVESYTPPTEIFQSALAKLDSTMANYNQLAVTLNKRLSNDQFFQDLDKTMQAAPQTVEDFRQMTLTVSKQVEDLVAESRKVMTDLRDLSDRLGKQVDSQGQNLDRLTAGLLTNVENLNRMLLALNRVTETINKGEGTVGGLLMRDEVYKELVATLQNSQKMLAEIRDMAKFIQEHPDALFWGHK